MDNTLRIF